MTWHLTGRDAVFVYQILSYATHQQSSSPQIIQERIQGLIKYPAGPDLLYLLNVVLEILRYCQWYERKVNHENRHQARRGENVKLTIHCIPSHLSLLIRVFEQLIERYQVGGKYVLTHCPGESCFCWRAERGYLACLRRFVPPFVNFLSTVFHRRFTSKKFIFPPKLVHLSLQRVLRTCPRPKAPTERRTSPKSTRSIGP